MWSDWLVVCDCGFSLSALWCPLSVTSLILVSLTLNVGYLFMAAPAKRSHCSLLWTWGSSSQPCLQLGSCHSCAKSPLDWKEIQPVHPKRDWSWVFIGRTDVEAETPILWPPVKSWLFWKDPDAGKDWRQEEKGTTEDEMVGWHHRLNGYGFGWTPGVGDGQGGLACCGLWGRKESDTIEQLNWTEASLQVMCWE